MRRGQGRRGVGVALSLLLALPLLVSCPSAPALNPSLEVSQYAHTEWKIRDGFTKGAISSIAQTPDGYLWLGTEFGLVRFDGVRAVPWRPPNQHLPPGTIYSLLVSRTGTLWIGTSKGLASWKDGKLARYPEFDGEIVFALLEDAEGTIWAGAGGAPLAGRLCAIRRGTVACFGGDGRLGPGVIALYEDSGRNLWVGVKNGVWRWKPGPPKFYLLPGAPNGIQALAEDLHGALLIGWRGGIFRLVNGKTEPYSLPGISRPFNARRLLRDQSGALWIGTVERGLVHIHQGRIDVFSPAEGLSGDFVYRIFEDREGNIWTSTIDGLDRFRDFTVATLTAKQGLSANLVQSVVADKSGSVWLATNSGLNRWDHGKIKTPPTGGGKRDGKLHGSAPNSLFHDDSGRLWVSTLHELGYLQNGRFISIKGIPGGNILSMAQDAAGSLWAINEPQGLLHVSPQTDVQQIRWSGLGHQDNASVLAADRRHGGLWIGFYSGGIAYWSDGRIRASYTARDGLGAGRVADFQFDKDDALWISTEGGFSRLSNNRVATLNSKNGLPCDTVHWATEDDDLSLWLYMACGLVRIARPELDAWAANMDKGQDTTRAIKVTVFDSSDGVRSLSSPGHYHPQVTRSIDGKLWFLPWDGVSVIDPRHIPFNKVPPPVHIEQIIADGKTYDVSDGLHLPPHVRDLTIDYTALSLVAPEKVHFRFKLEGQDKDWREVINNREIQYSNLAPRKYRFRVLACNNSGVWNEEGASLDFLIPPMWYQTNWFSALCVVAFLGLLWLIYGLRVRHLHQRFAMIVDARVNERTRIARELHDTVLQSLHGLLMSFQRAANVLPERPLEAKQRLEGAIDQAARAITEGREAVQGLRSSTVVTNDLAVAIRALGEELAAKQASEDAPIFCVAIEGAPRDLNPILRDDVYRIAGEALRNAFHHAQAKRVEVEIQYDDRHLRLRIRDDGKGVAPEAFNSQGRSGHFGLQGMRERAKLVGGHLEIWSELDSGTEIQLSIPASIAYLSSAQRQSRTRMAK